MERAVPLEALADAAGSPSARLYPRPVGILAGAAARAALAAGTGRRLAGGRLVFTGCEVLVRDGGMVWTAVAPIGEVLAWAEAVGAKRLPRLVDTVAAPRAPLAGLALGRPLIMGIVNVTPDSFSDGGAYFDPAAAIAHGKGLLEAGADILDVGGESTRPGATPVAVEEELRRVLPVLRGLAPSGAVLSIDTRHGRVMAEALAAGAALVNDVSALTHDPQSLTVVAESGAPVILMHMQGEPETMQVDPRYDHAPLDVYDYLAARVEACTAAGIERTRIVVDPGIGFGKTGAHNVEILDRLGLYHALGCAVLVGLSRKRFIAGLSKDEPPHARIPGSLAGALAALDQGAQIVRVHDVAETRQALAVWSALTKED